MMIEEPAELTVRETDLLVMVTEGLRKAIGFSLAAGHNDVATDLRKLEGRGYWTITFRVESYED